MTSEPDLPLAAEFPPATREAWRKLVDGVLKGRPFDKLVSRSQDGIAIEPLYARAEAASPVAARAGGTPWQVVQRIDHPDAAAANAQALHDLENGATGLMIPLAGSVGAYGFGLLPTKTAIERALDGIYLDAGVAIEFDMTGEQHELMPEIGKIVRGRGIAPKDTVIRFGLDPFGAAAMRGTFTDPWEVTARAVKGIVAQLANDDFSGPFLVADGRVVHAAGGSEAQELAFAISAGVALLRSLESGGIPLARAAGLISFRLAADADEFLTIAKLRAFRKLWARVQDVCTIAPKPAHLTVETAWRMMTRRDANVNMLRATMATFSAAVGGADAIAVLPFTAALGLPDPFARRVARNTQLILAEESNLAKVSDPAAGSGAFEALTHELSLKAWDLFQEIETGGGLAAALVHGDFQKKITATREARSRAIALRRDPLTGTSEFPLLTERSPDVLAPTPPAKVQPAVFPPLTPHRLAEPFEAFRDASDRYLAKTGARPRVFLANLGKLADFLPRATFAKNFFEIGGIETVGNEGFAGPDGATDFPALTAALQASGAKLACLCGSDDAYTREAVTAAESLRGTQAAEIYLAGRPGDLEAALSKAGLTGYAYAGCDAVETLRAIHAKILAGTGS